MDRFNVQKVQSFIVIIRAIHCRGEKQLEAMAELKRRGLWLSDEQKAEAQLQWLDNG